jgi:hypothetical protein
MPVMLCWPTYCTVANELCGELSVTGVIRVMGGSDVMDEGKNWKCEPPSTTTLKFELYGDPEIGGPVTCMTFAVTPLLSEREIPSNCSILLCQPRSTSQAALMNVVL